MDTKDCVRCGTSFSRPSRKGGSWWRKRRFCTVECYRAREPEPLAIRFWRNVQKGDGCWEWTAARGGSNYGAFGLTRDRMMPAHRFSWELHFGLIPAGLLVCHHCDNPPCVRPDHLFLGTPLANTRDMDRKGRRVTSDRRGSRNVNAILSEADIPVIRAAHASGESYGVIASRYGVTGELIGQIVRRKAWRHVA